MAAQVYYIKLTALTPVHVGVENEKHWKPGLDAVVQGGKLHVIDMEKLMQKSGGASAWIDELSLRIAEARLGPFLQNKNINPAEVALHTFKLPSGISFQDVRPFIRTGGRPYIPGSSLKGAIRSAMIHHLGAPADTQRAEQEWFGQIGNNLMRFLHVGDGSFNRSRIVLTKILSNQLQNNPEENKTGWKHQRSGMQDSLNPPAFSTCYETLGTHESVFLRMSFQADALRIAENTANFNTNHRRLFPKGAERENLISILNQYTLTHLQREIDFFKRFKPETHDDLDIPFDSMLKEVTKATETKGGNIAFLRMGHGIGFHAITGDWQNTDHLKMVTRINDAGNPRKARKTRRLVIENDEIPEPMGFIRLDFLTEEAWSQGVIENDQKSQEMVKKAAANVVSAPVIPASELPVPAEPLKPEGPEYKELERIKQGDVVDAICEKAVPGSARLKEFKLLLTINGTEGKEPVVQLGYADPEIIGKLCRVKISQLDKKTKRINAIEFAGKK